MKKTLYIAYGSNINLKQMAFRCPTAKVVGTSEIKGYELQFKGVATIAPKEESKVPVLVWELKSADEKSLDRYEGHPSLYRKETLEVEINGKSTPAMVYIMNGNSPLQEPTELYYNGIEKGYIENGLDLSYLEKALEQSIEAEIQGQQHGFDDQMSFNMNWW